MLKQGPWDLLSLSGTQVSKTVGSHTADSGCSSQQQRLLQEKLCTQVVVGVVGWTSDGEVACEEFGCRDRFGAQLEMLCR